MRLMYPAFICLILVTLFETGCNPKSITKCGPCPALAQVLPNINFRVVDKTTNQDLFFGGPYKVNQLKMHHIVNGKPDTVFLRVDTLNRLFNIFVIPNHRVDTVTMQVADKPQDILLFNTSTTGGCCPFLILSSVTFNGTVVYTHANGSDVVALRK